MEIKKDEFYKRLATEVMMSMSDVYYDDLIGYRWQIPESDFFNDVVGYVSIDDWDEKNVKEIEKEISKGLSALHEFMGGFYVCNYEDEDGDEVQGSLWEAMSFHGIKEGFKTEWTLVELNEEWNQESGYTFVGGEWERSFEENIEMNNA